MCPSAGSPDPKLNITVVFTSSKATEAALKSAGVLASSLGARISLLVFETVPYPLPLDNPPVRTEWNEERIGRIASESPVETTVRLFVCRDRAETLKDALARRSVVVIGGHRRTWPHTAESRLAQQLRGAGHEVIFIETE